ncbi:MAG: response regulator [Paracoccaceae bacterium]|nr:response regulator [Paracoccaceae bacterium]
MKIGVLAERSVKLAGLKSVLKPKVEKLSRLLKKRLSLLYDRLFGDSVSETKNSPDSSSVSLHSTQAQRDAECLQTFADMAPTGLTIKSADGRYIRLSEHALQSYGSSKPDNDYATSDDWFAPEIAKIIKEQDEEVLKTADVVKKEFSAELDGEPRSFLISKFPIFAEGRRPVGIAALSLDIGEDSAAHKRLLANEDRMKGMFDNAPVPLLEEDWSALKRQVDDLCEKGVTDVSAYLKKNPEFRNQMYDSCEQTLVSSNIVKMYGATDKQQFIELLNHKQADPEEIEGFSKAVDAFSKGASSFTHESNETTVDGQHITTRLKFSIPTERLGDWKQVIVSSEDITKQREIEERMRNSQRMETIGRLAAGVSHDFNNLLAVIQGSLDVEFFKNGNSFKSMQNIQDAVDRGAELTRHLLNYSRSEASLEPQQCALDIILSDLGQLIGQAVGQAITVRVDLDCSDYVVLTDPGFAKDAFLNIALNARDAMPDGGELKIESVIADYHGEMEESGGGPDVLVVVSFTDTGVGMDEATAANASKPFFTTKVIGTGIGLASVHDFIEKSGGSLNIESTPDVGTKVSLTFPAWAGATDGSKVTFRSLAEVSNAGLNILLVEDSEIYLEIISEQLEHLGHRVIKAADGTQGYEAFQQNPEIDLVLSDIILPNSYSGLDLGRDIIDIDKHQKIVFMTGYSPNSEGDISRQFPEAKLLQKPFRLETLSEKIDVVMQDASKTQSGLWPPFEVANT